MTNKKTKHQKTAYSLRRLSKAVDRIIIAETQEEKEKAKKWAHAWGLRGQFAPRS